MIGIVAGLVRVGSAVRRGLTRCRGRASRLRFRFSPLHLAVDAQGQWRSLAVSAPWRVDDGIVIVSQRPGAHLTGMIVVIADDVSGAAELAAVAHAWGLSAELQTEFNPEVPVDVISLDANTRSLTAAEAGRTIRELGARVVAARPAWIYKKTDSVLRGHVRLEISGLMEAAQKPRALLIPANPSRGRVVRGGEYFVDGCALHQTIFGADPEYPATSCSVLDLLGRTAGTEVCHFTAPDQFPRAGIAIPDVTCAEDLTRFAALVDEVTLAAGAAEFFQTLLRTRVGKRPRPSQERLLVPAAGKSLFVCGSLAGWPVRSRQFAARNWPIYSMAAAGVRPWEPAALSSTSEARLVSGAIEALATRQICLLAIGDVVLPPDESPSALVTSLANLAARVIASGAANRIFLEGGATAAAVLRQARWSRLRVEDQLGPGLPILRVPGVNAHFVTIKPGSYPWPEELWEDVAPALPPP